MFSLQDSPGSKNRVNQEGRKGKKEKEEEVEKEKEEMRTKKRSREQIYHMCFDCRKGILIVE